ncbi:hypothetical protein M408DRAFT_163872 [Serendipita vermifera MAFF 305830]|uniref:Condensin complex subunit 1 C-terminal domain-containing protein n=1 Tax=Serendipita vermifera MAFF 305830 TaxID=933852 RepID=A0A0C3AT40_SERVB|nr:hypothetical protein M408DRAFT_163872 [Serendipita vermifera MAFF 305830]
MRHIAELHDLVRQTVPALINLCKDKGPDVRSAAITTLGKLAENAELRTTVRKSLTQIIHLFSHRSPTVPPAAAGLVCTLSEDPLMRASVKRRLKHISPLLKNNAPATRAAAAKVVETLMKYPDSQSTILQSSLPLTLVERLQDHEVDVLKPLTGIFCFLVNQGQISQGIVQVILDALRALDHADTSIQACGATILLVMAAHAHFRDILCEVCAIHASFRLFMRDASPQDADIILQRMEYFGLLKEL